MIERYSSGVTWRCSRLHMNQNVRTDDGVPFASGPLASETGQPQKYCADSGFQFAAL